MKVPGGKYAVARFEVSAEQFGEAWDEVMGKSDRSNFKFFRDELP
jgi:DNA gyrase inhibitor GyrI